MTIASLNLLGTCNVQIQCVREYFPLTEDFSLSRQKELSMSWILECKSTCQLGNIPLEEQKYSFLLKRGRGIYFLEETQKLVKDVTGDVYCPTCWNKKCVNLSTNKNSSFHGCKKCKACTHLLIMPFKVQKLTTFLFGGDGSHRFAKKTKCDNEKEKPSPFSKKFISQSQSSTPELVPKKTKIIPFMA